jgi:hypothetical protein
MNQLELAKLAEPLFQRYYMCSTTYRDSMSVEDVRKYGLVGTGNAEIDKRLHNDLVDKWTTVNTMVEMFKSGTVFYVRNHADTKEIYDIISAYLNGWKLHIENSINVDSIPVDDLVQLDRLASKVYDHAVEHFKEDYFVPKLARIATKSRTAFAPAASKTAVVVRERQEVQERLPQDVKRHAGSEEFFSKHYFNGRGL